MRKRFYLLVCLIFLFLTGCETGEQEVVLTQLSLMSYNIHHGVNLQGTYNLEGVRETIEQTGADIVALQEVDQNWGTRSQNDLQLDMLAQQLGLYSAFAGALASTTGQYGVGILSKYPITFTETHVLPGKLEQRVLLIAGIQLNGEQIYVFTTHLGLSEEDRAAQIRQILQIARPYSGKPVILLGDLNTSQAEELKPLLEQFKGEEAIPLNLNETLIAPRLKIDYIFATHPVALLKVVSVLSPSSDHYPVYAKIGVLW